MKCSLCPGDLPRLRLLLLSPKELLPGLAFQPVPGPLLEQSRPLSRDPFVPLTRTDLPLDLAELDVNAHLIALQPTTARTVRRQMLDGLLQLLVSDLGVFELDSQSVVGDPDEREPLLEMGYLLLEQEAFGLNPKAGLRDLIRRSLIPIGELLHERSKLGPLLG